MTIKIRHKLEKIFSPLHIILILRNFHQITSVLMSVPVVELTLILTNSAICDSYYLLCNFIVQKYQVFTFYFHWGAIVAHFLTYSLSFSYACRCIYCHFSLVIYFYVSYFYENMIFFNFSNDLTNLRLFTVRYLSDSIREFFKFGVIFSRHSV